MVIRVDDLRQNLDAFSERDSALQVENRFRGRVGFGSASRIPVMWRRATSATVRVDDAVPEDGDQVRETPPADRSASGQSDLGGRDEPRKGRYAMTDCDPTTTAGP